MTLAERLAEILDKLRGAWSYDDEELEYYVHTDDMQDINNKLAAIIDELNNPKEVK